jgi:hypothetical protein
MECASLSPFSSVLRWCVASVFEVLQTVLMLYFKVLFTPGKVQRKTKKVTFTKKKTEL